MSRLVLISGIALLLPCASSFGQCGRWAPSYPAPIYVPISPPPFVPKKSVAVKEKDEPAPKIPAAKDNKELEAKDREFPRIPKTKLVVPDDPEELNPSKSPPKPKKLPETAVEQYVVPVDEGAKPAAEVRVGFFNHSDRELVLEVNGEEVRLPSEQYVTVRLTRTFTWSEKGRKGKDVVVPPDAEGIEIVFRK